jgi:hypothetical protein
VSRLSRQCGILNISQPYRLPRSVTGIALLFTFYYSGMSLVCRSAYMQPGIRLLLHVLQCILRNCCSYSILPFGQFSRHCFWGKYFALCITHKSETQTEIGQTWTPSRRPSIRSETGRPLSAICLPLSVI